jgi:flagellar biosynthesis GTPase FlhF
MPIITNSSIQILLKQSPSSIDKLQQVFNLTDEEKYLLLESDVGEGIFFAGIKHVAIKIIASYTEDQIITSDPSQILRSKKLKKNSDYERRERITPATKMMMLMTAICLWLLVLVLSIIPFVNDLLDPMLWIIFGFWFWLCGASLAKNKGKNIASFVVGLIPFVGPILSAFPVVMYYNIKTIQKEDAEFNALQEANLQEENQDAQESALMEQAQIEEEEAAEEDLEEEESEENLDEEDELDEEDVEEEQAREPEPEPEEEEPTGQDALDALNNKQNRNREDNELLRQASEIMRSGTITPAARNNPVLLAAYTKYQSGIREYNPNNPNPDPQKSYKFGNTSYQ